MPVIIALRVASRGHGAADARHLRFDRIWG
jgi:hypothetical protein